MSNTNNTMQTQTSNTLHNAIMEAGVKDHPPMLASGIDNDIYSTVDACPNASEMWKAIERLKQVYHHQNHPTHYTQNSSTISQQTATRNRGTTIINSPPPIYDQELSMVAKDDEMSKDKEIDKLMALISLSFKKIYNPTNNNLQTSSNTSRANQDNSSRINRGIGYESQKIGNVAGARETVGTTVVQKSGIQCYNCKEFGHVATECQKPKRAKDAAYHREKMLLCKQEEAGFQLNAEQADWRDDTDDESENQELEAHYMYMAQSKEVTPDAANDSGPIFDTEPVQKVQNNDNYNVFAIECKHPVQSKSVHDTYLIEQDEHNVIIDSLDMSYDREQIDQNDDDDDLANKHELLASLIEKLKYLKKFQAELDRRNNVEYASKVEIDCAKAKGDLISYKMESQKSFNKYTQTINDLNQMISAMKKELSAHQETIFILSQAKEAQIKLYKTFEKKELDKVIALENKVKVLDNIVYKTGQSAQTMNMLNRNYKTSFAKPEFLKKAQRANPRLYDIGCFNDNLALMLAPESNEVIRLEKESRSKLSNLISPFDYEKLNNVYDLFVPQREKPFEHRYFPERSRMSHTPVNNGNSNETFNKQTTLLEKQMDESIPYDQQCKISKELFKIKRSVGTIIDGVEHCKETIAKRTYFGHIVPFIQNTIEANFCPEIRRINADLEKFHVCLKEEMVAEREQYFEIQDLKAQLHDRGIAIGVISHTSVSRPQLKSNPMEDRVMLNDSQGKKQEVEDHRRIVKFSKNKTSVTACNDNLKAKTSNVNFVCAACGKCVLNEKHDTCVLQKLNSVKSRTKMPIDVPVSTREPKTNCKSICCKTP
uniref:CCHC-type domain-containing protein n=1 Tax=Tanacetum cinerariifolium TaxID=118510 RepID=A0A699HZI3_TANCI|nr:hypothetical protein [Tanacetum cinerariifolium]